MQAGNDFLPHVPSIDIYDKPCGLDLLFTAYKELLPKLGGHISSAYLSVHELLIASCTWTIGVSTRNATAAVLITATLLCVCHGISFNFF